MIGRVTKVLINLMQNMLFLSIFMKNRNKKVLKRNLDHYDIFVMKWSEPDMYNPKILSRSRLRLRSSNQLKVD